MASSEIELRDIECWRFPEPFHPFAPRIRAYICICMYTHIYIYKQKRIHALVKMLLCCSHVSRIWQFLLSFYSWNWLQLRDEYKDLENSTNIIFFTKLSKVIILINDRITFRYLFDEYNATDSLSNLKSKSDYGK